MYAAAEMQRVQATERGERRHVAQLFTSLEVQSSQADQLAKASEAARHAIVCDCQPRN
jgi:hypothetical protein